MTSRRVATLVVLAVAVLALAHLAACGDSEEQAELRSYSRWVDKEHATQERILSPIETGQGSLEGFVNELPALRRAGKLAQIYAAARASKEFLARIRDEVVPAHRTFRQGVEAMRPQAPSIAKVHGRFRRAVELRERGIVTISAVATLVDELLALEKVEGDPALQGKVQTLVNEVQTALNESLAVFAKSDVPLATAARRTIEVLVAAEPVDAELARKVQQLVATQEEIFGSFKRQLEVAGPAQMVPLLGAVEARMIPDFDKLVAGTVALEMPEGEARDVWRQVVEIFRSRAAALRPLPALRAKIQRIDELAKGMPEMAAVEIVDRIIERVPSAGDDLQQALTMYQNFATELRRLRADVL